MASYLWEMTIENGEKKNEKGRVKKVGVRREWDGKWDRENVTLTLS